MALRMQTFVVALTLVLATSKVDAEGVCDDVSLLQSTLTKVQHTKVMPEEPCAVSMLQDLATSNSSVKSFAHFDHGSDFEGLYVNKKAKFAFCLIEKNACSKWSTIMGRIEHGNFDTGPKYGIAHATFSPADAAYVFNDRSATRAVFVRDPLERFLSAFLDKCTDIGCTNSFCHMRDVTQFGSPIPFSLAVEWLKKKNVDALGHNDGHWTSQSSHCELRSRLHEYTVLGLMESTTLAQNANCLLERAGLSSVNVKSSDDSASFWQVPSSVRNENENTEYLKSFYTKEAAEMVYQKFKEDYTLFNIRRPSWIGDAHGKFFNETQHTQCEPMLVQIGTESERESSSGHGDALDDDDISTLARRAGFLL
jgi:hypothetical protein